MKLTILGSGTSQGVPTIGCQCEVCRSTDPRDKRLRSSAMVEWDGMRIVIDAGPDFRYQMLRAGARSIDALMLTHSHKDHTGGIDDTRAFNFVDYPKIHRVQLYATPNAMKTVRKDYDYAFAENKYIGAPEIDVIEFEPGARIKVSNEEGTKSVYVEAIRGFHAVGFEITGYRFGDIAYLTDFKSIEPSEIDRLRGVKVLVVNALRWKEHYSHFNVNEALALIREVAPERAYLTHSSHDIGLFADINPTLPDGVELAYDGLEIEI
ncbi:MAG: MBL fold metallo-hydrolase [Rikenellaceae bacterium]